MRYVAERARSEAGFTLLELLVAMTLLALVMMVLLGSLRFGTRVWEHTEAHGAGAQDIGIVQGLFRRAVLGAYPMLDASDPTRPRVDFSGSAEKVTLLAPMPFALGSGGRARVTFSREDEDGRPALVMTVTPELAWRSGPDASRRETLLRGLQTVRLSYFGSKDHYSAARWHDSWSDATRLPQLVRLDVTFAEDERRTWPLLIVAPSVDVDVSCRYDPLTRYCQGR